MAALATQAQGRRAEDDSYVTPRWLRAVDTTATPIGVAPWDRARAADLSRGTWTTVHHGTTATGWCAGPTPAAPTQLPTPT